MKRATKYALVGLCAIGVTLVSVWLTGAVASESDDSSDEATRTVTWDDEGDGTSGAYQVVVGEKGVRGYVESDLLNDAVARSTEGFAQPGETKVPVYEFPDTTSDVVDHLVV